MPRDWYRLTVDYLLLLPFPPFLRFLRESDSELHRTYFDRINPSPRRDWPSSLATNRRFECVSWRFDSTKHPGPAEGWPNVCCMFSSTRYVATDRRALSQLLLLHGWCHNIIRSFGVSHTARKDEFRQNSISQQLECIFIFIISRSEARRPTVSLCVKWSRKDLLRVLSAWHTVSLPSSFNSSNAFIIIFLLLVAVNHSRLVDGILVVVRDSTEQ